MNLEKTNSAFLQGAVGSVPTFSHNFKGENFYTFNLEVNRLSNEKDIIPIIISDRLMPNLSLGDKIALRGQFRSHDALEEGRHRVLLAFFCKELCEVDLNVNSNVIDLTGTICKPPIYRNTPLAREICDVHLAVNRNFHRSDYIPCIAWGRNAKFISELPVGSRLKVVGRIQSREYKKQIEGQEPVNRRCYEVSISAVTVINEKIAEPDY